MKILVTGGAGYIGSSIVSSLGGKYDIVSSSRKDFNLSNPLDTKRWFNRNGYFDVIIHAAISGGSRLKPDGKLCLDENLSSYYNLLDNRGRYSRFISFGSGAEMSPHISHYALSKRVISESINSRDNFYNLRIYGVFDENELPSRFIKGNILRALDGLPLEIHEDKVMDFFYMKDLMSLVDFYITSSNPPKMVECSYPEKESLFTIAKYINLISGNKSDILFNSEKIGKNYIGNGELPIEYIGLKPGIDNTFKTLKHDKYK